MLIGKVSTVLTESRCSVRPDIIEVDALQPGDVFEDVDDDVVVDLEFEVPRRATHRAACLLLGVDDPLHIELEEMITHPSLHEFVCIHQVGDILVNPVHWFGPDRRVPCLLEDSDR